MVVEGDNQVAEEDNQVVEEDKRHLEHLLLDHRELNQGQEDILGQVDKLDHKALSGELGHRQLVVVVHMGFVQVARQVQVQRVHVLQPQEGQEGRPELFVQEEHWGLAQLDLAQLVVEESSLQRDLELQVVLSHPGCLVDPSILQMEEGLGLRRMQLPVVPDEPVDLALGELVARREIVDLEEGLTCMVGEHLVRGMDCTADTGFQQFWHLACPDYKLRSPVVAGSGSGCIDLKWMRQQKNLSNLQWNSGLEADR